MRGKRCPAEGTMCQGSEIRRLAMRMCLPNHPQLRMETVSIYFSRGGLWVSCNRVGVAGVKAIFLFTAYPLLIESFLRHPFFRGTWHEQKSTSKTTGGHLKGQLSNSEVLHFSQPQNPKKENFYPQWGHFRNIGRRVWMESFMRLRVATRQTMVQSISSRLAKEPIASV